MAQKLWHNKDWLEAEYKKYGTSTIAKQCGIDDSTVRYWLNKYNIQLRTRSESLKITTNRKGIVDKNFFKEIDNHTKSYWLGFMMADGTIREYRKGCYSASLELSVKDKQTIFDFSNNIKYKGNIYCDNSRYRIIINDYDFCYYLIQHNVIPRKTGNEAFPNINENLQHDFIRGFFDGDGCIRFYKRNTINKAKFHIVCANYDFLKSLQDIFYVHDITFSEKALHSKSLSTGTVVYELETQTLPTIAKIYDYLYSNGPYMNRKKNIFDSLLQYYVTSDRLIKRYSPLMIRNNQTSGETTEDT